jgi:hypothetical protein
MKTTLKNVRSALEAMKLEVAFAKDSIATDWLKVKISIYERMERDMVRTGQL